MKLGFYLETVTFRGTTRAALEYIKLLANKSDEISVYFLQDNPANTLSILVEFISIGVLIRPLKSNLDLKFEQLDLLYYVTSQFGESSSWLSTLPFKVLFHQVGFQPPEYASNLIFAYTSYWQSFYFTNGAAKVLPYIIPEPLSILSQKEARLSLDLPLDAVILGRHGGLDTFNLPFAKDSILESLNSREDIVYLFLNTPKFVDHRRAIFFDGTNSADFINRYIYSCDAMLHARWEGETFGLACSEFLSRGKPIITWSESRERNHIFLADKSAIFYNQCFDLSFLLCSVSRSFLDYKSGLIPTELLDLYSPHHIRNTLIELVSENIYV